MKASRTTMGKVELIEGNRLIAEFMGWRTKDVPDGFAFTKDGYWMHCQQCYYNSSWEWIMPVIDGLRSTKSNMPIVEISFCLGVIVKMFYRGEWHSYEGNEALETIWIAVVEFIKHYNATHP